MRLNQPSFIVVCFLVILSLSNLCFASETISQMNNDFHQAYASRVEDILQKTGAPGGIPVILNLGGRFIFKHNGQSESMDVSSTRFHTIKAFSHAFFATDLILQHLNDGALPIDRKEKLAVLQQHLRKAVAEINQLDLSDKEKTLVSNLAEHNLSYIHHLLKNNQFSAQANQAFFSENNKELEKIIKAAAKIELTLMDQTVNRWLDTLTVDECAKLGVVVATAHQARADELSLQYFSRKFGYQYGQGAQHEKDFVVLEGKFDEASALQLLARHYLDREAATTIFDDPERLQSDVLGPAAHDILSHSATCSAEGFC